MSNCKICDKPTQSVDLTLENGMKVHSECVESLLRPEDNEPITYSLVACPGCGFRNRTHAYGCNVEKYLAAV